ncbi:MAG: hypothetical protein ACP5GC_05110, partial [Thiomonas sp.]
MTEKEKAHEIMGLNRELGGDEGILFYRKINNLAQLYHVSNHREEGSDAFLKRPLAPSGGKLLRQVRVTCNEAQQAQHAARRSETPLLPITQGCDW